MVKWIDLTLCYAVKQFQLLRGIQEMVMKLKLQDKDQAIIKC